MSREAIIAWPNASITSVALTVTDDFTVAFVGTVDGQLRKVLDIVCFGFRYYVYFKAASFVFFVGQTDIIYR